jgi:hypothetical protein
MYTLGQNWNQLFEICWNGLKIKPNDELLTNVMKVLMEHDDKYGTGYKIRSGTINSNDLK